MTQRLYDPQPLHLSHRCTGIGAGAGQQHLNDPTFYEIGNIALWITNR